MTERPLLVLLHGWGSTAAVWQTVVERLQDDYECYLPELPGHGDSQFTEMQLEPLAQQIADSVNRPATWLGWSLGALVAMQAALQMPQQVNQLMLVSGTPAFVQHAGWDAAMSPDTFNEFQLAFSSHANKTQQRFIALQAHGDSQAKIVVQQLGRASTESSDAIAWGLDVLRGADLLERLSALSCPVNCLYGENDALVPVTVADAMREKAAANINIWPSTGHVPFLSQPDAFVAWIKESIQHG